MECVVPDLCDRVWNNVCSRATPGNWIRTDKLAVNRTPSTETKFLFPLETSILAKDPQSANGPIPIEVTDSGMKTDVRLLQVINAVDSMTVTELGMVTEVSPRHEPNALSPMDVTVLLMVTEVSNSHL